MDTLDHSNRKHALLSASGSSRWMNCTPSARLEEKFQDSQSSVYAQEGTLAHEFADITLRHEIGLIDNKLFRSEINKLKKEKLYTKEMIPQVQKYVDYCMEIYSEAKSFGSDSIMLVEERLDFSNIVAKGFGTGDNLILFGKTLYIIDLKYGRGIKVDAHENPQLKLYGIGALNRFELTHEITEVILVIVQPRLDHISEFRISSEELMFWGEKSVKPKAIKAYRGEGVQKAGDWCKWCKVKGMCATLAAENVKLARLDFSDPHFLKDQQLSDVYKQIPMLIDWAKSVSDHMVKEAIKGKKWPGLKVVLGRSKRKWKNEEEVKDTLDLLGYEKDEILNSKLKSLTDITHLIGEDIFQQYFSHLVIKPEGSPALVPDSDKRIGIGSAQARDDFKDPI